MQSFIARVVGTTTLLAFFGYSASQPTAPVEKKETAHSHDHGDIGPTGGALVTWGADEYHAELVLDRTAGEATVYFLDGSLKKVKPIDAVPCGDGAAWQPRMPLPGVDDCVHRRHRPRSVGDRRPETGREILYPVATVILGGLFTSTFCEFLLHPGLFWRFSR
jgi:hypothetical protein